MSAGQAALVKANCAVAAVKGKFPSSLAQTASDLVTNRLEMVSAEYNHNQPLELELARICHSSLGSR